ncbi:MAG TPA: tetratricopeptide repeat protein [Candidatus Angelobacter sp.]|jgi:tetratricopeptide (TPR) repeat protein|nr:tetratricopeptide repeat protein [Candidatus Angelobacter sp.]
MKFRILLVLLLFAALPAMALAQDHSQDDKVHIQPRKKPVKPEERPQEEQPKQDEQPQPAGESSSADSKIVLGASTAARTGGTPELNTRGSSDVNETYPFDPHRAAKDVEVGEFYLRQKNYRAALERFNDALHYKPKDAIATFRLAQAQEQMGLLEQAYRNYDGYLEILPSGPFAKDARDGLKRIDPKLDVRPVEVASADQNAAQVRQDIEVGESYLARNDYQGALQRFEEAVRLSPEDPVVNLRMAESLQGLQRLDQARRFYQKYLTLQPKGQYAADAKRGIAQINAILGK